MYHIYIYIMHTYIYTDVCHSLCGQLQIASSLQVLISLTPRTAATAHPHPQRSEPIHGRDPRNQPALCSEFDSFQGQRGSRRRFPFHHLIFVLAWWVGTFQGNLQFARSGSGTFWSGRSSFDLPRGKALNSHCWHSGFLGKAPNPEAPCAACSLLVVERKECSFQLCDLDAVGAPIRKVLEIKFRLTHLLAL